MRYAGMFVGLLIFGAKLAYTAHAIYALERVSVATYKYATGHHDHEDRRETARP
ncbi:hypothetical protein [Hyphomicrobium sp.]|jgi:hypothetical protein|uniref:hypothetical protein n=1 Tax=Hyphomicrobium sp. TaxID=82 RepID=UPI0025BEE732|nr:hypothetical protein [Hyphomicrobium sp.]